MVLRQLGLIQGIQYFVFVWQMDSYYLVLQKRLQYLLGPKASPPAPAPDASAAHASAGTGTHAIPAASTEANQAAAIIVLSGPEVQSES